VVLPISITPKLRTRSIERESTRAGHRCVLNARELLTANLPLIERAIAFTCRRYHLDATDQEDFGSVVKLKLIENDYAIIRKFEGRSSFGTFMLIVVQRLLFDYRNHMWGKWHPSAEAKRLGDAAMMLERLMHRDGRSFEEAAVETCTAHPEVTRTELETFLGRLPHRGPKRRNVDVEEAEGTAVTSASETEESVLSGERARTSARVSRIMREAIAALPSDERLLLQLRFECEMSVAQIARSLGEDQKHLYRRIEKQMRQLRAQLEHNGIAADEVLAVIGSDGALLDFRLANGNVRPSTSGEGVAGGQESSR